MRRGVLVSVRGRSRRRSSSSSSSIVRNSRGSSSFSYGPTYVPPRSCGSPRNPSRDSRSNSRYSSSTNQQDANQKQQQQQKKKTTYPPPRRRIRAGDNPFTVLGVAKTATYSEVKSKFLQLALQYHPDQNSNSSINSGRDNNDEKKSPISSSEQFIQLRQAFERIREDREGQVTETTITKEEGKDAASWSDAEFRAWYYNEQRRSSEEDSNNRMTVQLDTQTRQEVIEAVKSYDAAGGLDRGGIWDWARRIAEEDAHLQSKKKQYPKPAIGLEPKQPATNFDSSSSSSNTRVQRRRRRNR